VKNIFNRKLNKMKKIFTILAAAICINSNAQICLTSSNFPAGSNTFSGISADFNNDGKADLATVNASANSVSILLGNGAGSLGSATNFATGFNPGSVITADFNGDGNSDLVTGNSDSTISLLLGNGAGSFGASVNFMAWNSSSSITSADFNGDGKADIAAASSHVTILLGTGTGSFGASTSFGMSGGLAHSITSGDFNGDGKVDLATANGWSHNVSVLLGTGVGSFGAATNFNSGTMSISIISTDFNGDGKADLATADYNSNGVTVLLGTGTGNFGVATYFSTGNSNMINQQSFSVISADFNGDTKADLAVASPNSNDVSVLLGTGTGSFAPADTFAVGSGPYSVISADFNNDGKVDLATANQGSNNVSVLLNSPIYTVSISATANTICPGSSSILTASGITTYSWSTGATTNTVSVAPAVTTIYTVKDGFGCSNTASVTINVATVATPNICMVTTDIASNYNYNVVYWDKTLYPRVDSFIVYRQVSSSYLRIGAVSKNALSEFTDTAFSIGGPNGGNPQYSSWQYKLAIRDTCGNIGAKSPYHQSMFVQESGSNFSWNAYTVEAGQANPITGYSFLRDNNNTGNWNVLVNTSGLSTTDPNFATYPNGNWRIDATGFNCTPTMRLAGNNNTQNTYLKAHSNTTKQAPVGINQLALNNEQLTVYPNPTSGKFIIETKSTEKQTVQVFDLNGRLVLSQDLTPTLSKGERGTATLDATTLNEGIYNLTIKSSSGVINKKLVIVRS